MNSSNVEILEKAISKTSKILIWLTDESLSLETEHLDEIDLFSNRLITQSILNPDPEDGFQTSLFVAENFGNSFFIFHHIFHPENSLSQIQSNFESIRSKLSDNDEIIILNKSHNTQGINIVKELKKSYPSFTYNNLYL